MVLHELDFVNDFRTAGTFLEQTVRNVALLATLRFQDRFFEYRHMRIRRGRRSPREWKGRQPSSRYGRTRSTSHQLSAHHRSKARASVARLPFFVNETHYVNFPSARCGQTPFGWWCNGRVRARLELALKSVRSTILPEVAPD